MTQFWNVGIVCAQCGEERTVEQPGILPGKWMAIVVDERQPSVARSPAEALREVVQHRQVPYPVCSPLCGIRLQISQAVALARTKAEKEAFLEALKDELSVL